MTKSYMIYVVFILRNMNYQARCESKRIDRNKKNTSVEQVLIVEKINISILNIVCPNYL